MKRALFLDRDGIINQVVFREGIVSSPRHINELQLIPETIQLVAKAKALGFFTVIITNQPDVSRRKMTRSQLNQIHRKIRQSIPVDHIEVCTSSDNNCFRRKPNPGMLLQSAEKFALELPASFFLGDSQKDIEAGKKAGVQTILYQTDYNKDHHGAGDFNCDHFDQVFEVINLSQR